MAPRLILPHRTNRCYDRRNIHSPLEQLVADLVAQAGNARYIGIQAALIPGRPAMVLFCGPCGSCLALDIPGLTVKAIRAKVNDKEAEFFQAALKRVA